MRHFTIFIALVLLLGQAAIAQDTVSLRRLYFTAVIKQAHVKPVKDHLAGFSDSAVLLSHEIKSLGFYDQPNTTYSEFKYKDLESVRVRRQGATVRGLAVGAICGLAAGALVGASQKSDWLFSTGDYIAYGSITGAVFGSIIGLVCGLTAHKTFIIRGRKERFDHMKSHLLGRVTKL